MHCMCKLTKNRGGTSGAERQELVAGFRGIVGGGGGCGRVARPHAAAWAIRHVEVVRSKDGGSRKHWQKKEFDWIFFCEVN